MCPASVSVLVGEASFNLFPFSVRRCGEQSASDLGVSVEVMRQQVDRCHCALTKMSGWFRVANVRLSSVFFVNRCGIGMYKQRLCCTTM